MKASMTVLTFGVRHHAPRPEREYRTSRPRSRLRAQIHIGGAFDRLIEVLIMAARTRRRHDDRNYPAVVAGSGTVTLLFTDLVGSTESLVALGEDRYDSVRDEHEVLVAGTIAAHHGEVVKSTGDGYMGAFPRAGDAVAAAAEVCAVAAGRASRARDKRAFESPEFLT